jgi:hypothetical protein
MNGWHAVPDERRRLYSPIGLRLIDDFTGFAPFGSVHARLDVKRANGDWQPTDAAAVRTPSDVLTYPGLGRSAHAATEPATHYRVRLDATFYRPDYLVNLEGIEFDAHPYDDDTPPAVIVGLPQSVFLMPAANYPFPGHVRVLRGQVLDVNGDPVASVEVTESAQERVLSDERGAFSLPLRWPALTAVVQIDALDHRSGRSGQLNANLPADLAVGHVITIS